MGVLTLNPGLCLYYCTEEDGSLLSLIFDNPLASKGSFALDIEPRLMSPESLVDIQDVKDENVIL